MPLFPRPGNLNVSAVMGMALALTGSLAVVHVPRSFSASVEDGVECCPGGVGRLDIISQGLELYIFLQYVVTAIFCPIPVLVRSCRKSTVEGVQGFDIKKNYTIIDLTK